MYCENCGAKIKEGAKFCQECGTPVPASEQASQPQAGVPNPYGQRQTPPPAQINRPQTAPVPSNKPPKKNHTLMIVAVVAVICIAAAVFAVSHRGGSSGKMSAREMEAIREEYPDAVFISSAEELQSISDDLDGTYFLTNDIDLAGFDWVPLAPCNLDNYNPRKWEFYIEAFTGLLDGNGYSIKNLSAVIDEENYEDYLGYGLFGYIKGTVRNLTLENFSIETTMVGTYGTLAYKLLSNGKVENCHVKNSVISGDCSSADLRVGGLFGEVSGHPSGCTFDGEIYIKNGGLTHCGGITGYGDNIGQCANYGNIYAEGVSSGGTFYIGGIIGRGNDCEKCSNYGDITVLMARGAYVGGISGYTSEGSTTIANCYNSGDLSAEVGGFGAIGGIAGDIEQSGNITNCYSIGSSVLERPGVVDGGHVGSGALVGYAPSDPFRSGCYYSSSASAKAIGSTSSGYSDNSKAINLELSQMKSESAFQGYDFSKVWEMGSGSYPYPILQWEKGSD